MNLNKLFGNELEKRDTAIQEFAEKHRQYVSTDGNGSATFGTEDTLFRVEADLNSELRRCYWGTITTYCPTKVIFHTGYKSSVEKVVKSFSKFIMMEGKKK